MAVNLATGVNSDTYFNLLNTGFPSVTASTLAARFNCSDVNGTYPGHLFNIGDFRGGFGQYSYLKLATSRGSGGEGYLNAYAGAGLLNSGFGSFSTTSFSYNVWHAGVGVFTATTQQVYVDGVATGPLNSSATYPGGYADTYIGVGATSVAGGSYGQYFGCVCEVAAWGTNLTQAEALAYSNGVSPALIRPGFLVFYVRLQNTTDLVNLRGPPISSNAGSGTITNCANSPRIILPRGFQVGQGFQTPPSTSRRLYYIERMDDRLWPSVENAWCVDSGLALTQPEPDATLSVSSATGDGGIRSYSIITGGSGYTSPIGQIEDAEGDGSGATVTFGLTSGVITSATATTTGSDYVHPILTILDTTGVGAVVNPVVTNYVTLSANANVFDTNSLGNIVRVGGGKVEVIAVNSGTDATGNVIVPIAATTPNDPDEVPLPVTSGNWTMTPPTASVSGLWHLEGKTVSALADGGVLNDLAVEDGSITLPAEASAIVAGLPFTAQLQTLYLEAPGGGTIQSRRKGDFQVIVRVQDSRAPEVGCNQPDAAAQPGGFNVPWTDMAQVRERSVNVPPGQPTPLYSGDYEPTNIFGTWDTRGQVAVQQSNPLPLTVVALVPWVKIGDTPS